MSSTDTPAETVEATAKKMLRVQRKLEEQSVLNGVLRLHARVQRAREKDRRSTEGATKRLFVDGYLWLPRGGGLPLPVDLRS